MKLRRKVVVEKPLNAVFDYLSDFTTTTEWDPGTVTTVRQHGNGGIGTTYLDTSRFPGRTTQLTYVVHELVDRQLIQLRGENKTVTAVDTLTFRPVRWASRRRGSASKATFTGPACRTGCAPQAGQCRGRARGHPQPERTRRARAGLAPGNAGRS